MTVSILDLHCLNAVCDDHEDVGSITAEVRKSSHGNVGDIDVADCLSELAAAGMVAALGRERARSSEDVLELCGE